MRSDLRKSSVRRAGRIFAAALAICTAAALCMPALAAEAADTGRTYTVRIYAGKQGEINREDSANKLVWERKYEEGARLGDLSDDFSALRDVDPKEKNKYYVKGIRESGKDYKEDNPSFTVDRDIDYVVSYGVLGNAVECTINYLDRDGNKLLESDTYYGNVGDQPIFSYRYIDGWLPQAYNLTKTLSENEAENVIDFIYTQTGAAGGEETEGTEGAGGEAAGEGAGAGGAAGAAGAGAAGAGGAAGADGGLVAAPDEGTPQDLINLDEEETPLANLADGLKNLFDPDGNGTILKVPKTLILGAAVLVALPFIYLAVRRKKAKKEQG